MLGSSCGREPLGTRGPPAQRILARGCGARAPGPGSLPGALAWLALGHGGAHRGIPRGGRGRGAQPGAGPESGGLVASPAFPSSVWLGSWALPEGKPARGVPRRYQSPGNLRWAFVTRWGRTQACSQPRRAVSTRLREDAAHRRTEASRLAAGEGGQVARGGH
ncbi:hypothetical protein NN561_008668 [Cricetulus griseus]